MMGKKPDKTRVVDGPTAAFMNAHARTNRSRHLRRSGLSSALLARVRDRFFEHALDRREVVIAVERGDDRADRDRAIVDGLAVLALEVRRDDDDVREQLAEPLARLFGVGAMDLQAGATEHFDAEHEVLFGEPCYCKRSGFDEDLMGDRHLPDLGNVHIFPLASGQR